MKLESVKYYYIFFIPYLEFPKLWLWSLSTGSIYFDTKK